MKNLQVFDWVVFVLVIIGGINWGLIGIFNFDIVGSIFGTMTTLTRIIYGIVGVSSLYAIYILSTKTE